MKRLLLVLLLTVGRLLAVEALVEPGPVIVPGQNEAEWDPLFAELGAKRSVFSTFTEHRWFPFRKVPVVLAGEMRFIPERGVSLHYTSPEERTVSIDAQGLIMRDAKGRTRELPSDPDSPAASSALLPILRFDRAQLDKVFVVHAVRAGTNWRLDFEPRDPRLAGTIGSIVVRGEGMLIRGLEFRRSAMQRVEIFIEQTRFSPTFSPDEMRRFFR